MKQILFSIVLISMLSACVAQKAAPKKPQISQQQISQIRAADIAVVPAEVLIVSNFQGNKKREIKLEDAYTSKLNQQAQTALQQRGLRHSFMNLSQPAQDMVYEYLNVPVLNAVDAGIKNETGIPAKAVFDLIKLAQIQQITGKQVVLTSLIRMFDAPPQEEPSAGTYVARGVLSTVAAVATGGILAPSIVDEYYTKYAVWSAMVDLRTGEVLWQSGDYRPISKLVNYQPIDGVVSGLYNDMPR